VGGGPADVDGTGELVGPCEGAAAAAADAALCGAIKKVVGGDDHDDEDPEADVDLLFAIAQLAAARLSADTLFAV